ncbi:MAG: PAS domain S-box protein [Chloroflexota bacterium]
MDAGTTATDTRAGAANSIEEAAPHRGLLLVILVAMLLIGGLAHYGDILGWWGKDAGRTMEALASMERVLFLLPVCYAGYAFGFRAGLLTILVGTLVMLPRALFFSSFVLISTIEVLGVAGVSFAVCFWFQTRALEKAKRSEALNVCEVARSECEVAREELTSKLEVIRKSENQLAALYAIANIVSQYLDLGQVLENALDKVIEVLGIKTAMIYLLDSETQELHLKAWRGIPIHLTVRIGTIKPGQGFSGKVVTSGEPVLIKKVSDDPRFADTLLNQEGYRTVLAVPLRSKGSVVGALTVASREPAPDWEQATDHFMAIGNQIGVAIENAYLYQRERDIISELRSVTTQLQMSEENYRQIFESASDMIWVHNLDGDIVAANKACERVTGYTRDELLKMNARQLLSGEGRRVSRKIHDRLLRGETQDKPEDLDMVRKDGSQVVVRVATSVISTNGQVTAFQHIGRDITEEKRQRENMQFYIQAAVKAQEEERRRIARELHDDTIQSLVALGHQIDRTLLGSRLPKESNELLEELRQRIDNILRDLRSFSQDLRPPILDDLGLLPALRDLAANLEQKTEVKTWVTIEGQPRRLPPETEVTLFRITQEALSNVGHHSKATHAEVVVKFESDRVAVIIADNGKGFNVPRRVGDLASTGKMGLAGMQERANLVGGLLAVYSRPNEGTTVVAEVPAELPL